MNAALGGGPDIFVALPVSIVVTDGPSSTTDLQSSHVKSLGCAVAHRSWTALYLRETTATLHPTHANRDCRQLGQSAAQTYQGPDMQVL